MSENNLMLPQLAFGSRFGKIENAKYNQLVTEGLKTN